MKQIKVIQLIDSLNVGGAEVLAVNIANALCNREFESHLCATRKEGDLKINLKKEVKYLFLNRKKTLDLRAIFRLKLYVKKNKIDVIHAHSSSSFIAFCVKLVYPKVRIIWHNHSGANIYLQGFKLKTLKIITPFFWGIINVNKNLNDWTLSALKHKNSIQLNNFPCFLDKKRHTFLKGCYGKRIVCIAGFRIEKDHLNLLKAFTEIVEKHPDWTLHLVGKSYNDDYATSITNFLEEYNLKENVFLYGVCSDVKHILEQSEIGVLSSKSEGLPISLLEYGLAKICVLVTDVGECKNVAKNKNAIVAPQRSDKFAQSLLNLINSTELRKKIATDFNTEVLKNYSEDFVMHQLLKLYLK